MPEIIYRYGPVSKTEAGLNEQRGIVIHSAEGYEAGMWARLADVSAPLAERVSWHFSVMQDGRIFSHYPTSAIAWHCHNANDYTVGIECEGIAREALTAAQLYSLAFLVRTISRGIGFTPQRYPMASRTLYEHNEFFATVCPSARIPWITLLQTISAMDTPQFTDDQITVSLDQARFRLIAALSNGKLLARFSDDQKSVMVLTPDGTDIGGWLPC